MDARTIGLAKREGTQELHETAAPTAEFSLDRDERPDNLHNLSFVTNS